MVTDVLVTWPTNADYPKWRQFIRDNRQRFNEIIIAFHQTHQGHDYRSFIQEAMFLDYVHFIQPTEPISGQDWRNISVNNMLMHSYNAPWIWFTEQDFYPLDGFWEEVERLEHDGCDVIAVYQEKRMHPCCIFMTRKALSMTRRDFGIIPNIADHFSMIQIDIEKAGLKVGVINPSTYYHHNGLSHNMTLLARGEMPNYEAEKFSKWLDECMIVSVPIPAEFVELAGKMRELHSPTPPSGGEGIPG